jgi:hypothetical protein
VPVVVLRARHTWLRLLLVGVFTLATLGVPRLHVHAMPDAATLELAAFTLPDGSLPQLCLA